MLQLLDVGADDPCRLDTFQAQLSVDLFHKVVAQSGHLAAQLRELVAQHPLHLATDHHRELLVMLAAPDDRALALGVQHLGLVGLATSRAEQRERTQQQAPEADKQADLNLLLGMADDDEINGKATRHQSQQHAEGAKCTSRAGTCCEGGHGQSLARRSGSTVSRSLRRVSG